MDRKKRLRLFSERLDLAMKLQGFRNRDLVSLSASQFSYGNLNHWLAGFCFPAHEHLILLAELLDLSIDYLLCKGEK